MPTTFALGAVNSGAVLTGVSLFADLPTDWEFVVTSQSSGTTILTFSEVAEASWEPQWSDAGSGSLSLPTDDPNLASIDYGNVIRCVYRGRAAFQWIANERSADTTPADGGVGLVTWSGPGRVAALSGARVYPSRGFGASPVEETRSFGWASVDYDDSTWGGTSISLGAMGTATAYWYGLANWPDPSTAWMWASGASTSYALTGDVYFRKSFSVSGGLYQLAFVCDDRGELYIDGQRMLTTGNWDNTTSSIRTTPVTLSSGTHTIAVWGQNNDGEVGNNPAGVLVNLRGAGTAGTVLNSGAGWTCLAYPWFPPSVTIGDALIKMIAEAQDAGALTGLTVGFTATVDSAGDPWPWMADVTAPVGSDLFAFLRAHAGVDLEFRMAPGSYHLDVWGPGGGGYTRSVTFHVPTSDTDPTSGNIRELAHVGQNTIANAAVVRWADGWVYVSVAAGGADVVEIELNYGHITTEDEATRIATDVLNDMATVREQITGVVHPQDSEYPWEHYAEGDTVTVPDSTGAATSQRVIAIAATITDDNIDITPTFKDRILEEFERHEAWLKTMSDGAARGNSNTVSPPKIPTSYNPPAPIASKTWSLPVWDAFTNKGVWEAQTLLVTRRLLVSLDSAATGTRTAVLKVNNATVATVSLSSTAQTGVTNIESAIEPGDLIGITTTGTETFGGNVTLEYLPG